MKKLILIALIFAGCGQESQPQKEVETTNETYQVELLFEVDGCKVYRFLDGGYYRYFTTCKGAVSWSTTEPSGKTTKTTHHNIETK